MRTFALGLLGAAALAAGLLAARSQQRPLPRPPQPEPPVQEDDGRSQGAVFLDRLRELGI
jgi:hypothetical protein